MRFSKSPKLDSAKPSWFREKPDAMDGLWVRPVSDETSYGRTPTEKIYLPKSS